MTTVSQSHIGLVRKENEDNLYVDEALGLYIVADGMGGHENGALASQLAVQTFVDSVNKAHLSIPELDTMRHMLNRANDVIYRYQKNGTGNIMGTTFTAAWIFNSTLSIAHIGDSRAYLINKNDIKQITNDHSYFAELARLGEFDSEQLVQTGQRNVLIKALGPEEHAEAQYEQFELFPDQTLLLCTDGLYNMVSDEEMHKIIMEASNLVEAKSCLLAMALERGGYDNITLVIYRHE